MHAWVIMRWKIRQRLTPRGGCSLQVQVPLQAARPALPPWPDSTWRDVAALRQLPCALMQAHQQWVSRKGKCMYMQKCAAARRVT